MKCWRAAASSTAVGAAQDRSSGRHRPGHAWSARGAGASAKGLHGSNGGCRSAKKPPHAASSSPRNAARRPPPSAGARGRAPRCGAALVGDGSGAGADLTIAAGRDAGHHAGRLGAVAPVRDPVSAADWVRAEAAHRAQVDVAVPVCGRGPRRVRRTASRRRRRGVALHVRHELVLERVHSG
jgi:hypothetical protein